MKRFSLRGNSANWDALKVEALNTKTEERVNRSEIPYGHKIVVRVVNNFYRVYDKMNHKIIADLICFADEHYSESDPLLLFDPQETWKKTKLAPGTYTLRELMVPVFKNGECVYKTPKVMDIRDYCAREQDTLWDESRRLVNPQEVHVDLSQKLWDVKQALINEFHGN